MSTKVSAVVKAVIREGDETAIVLALDSKNTASLEKDARVYVELTNAVNGDKVDFYPAPAQQPQAKVEPEEEEEEKIADPEPVIEEVVKEPEPPVSPEPEPSQELES